ncbi:MAG: NAD-dependent epimerase/dehydratase family protein [Gammaproteobacteria bacterium]|nr:NAD-dependent epimerase/dehydratase family protein [Gammaproteobacteria bacterium]
MSIAIVTGSGGLVGSESARYFHDQGMDVIGIDNDLRAYFFGAEASTRWNSTRLSTELQRFRSEDLDIRDREAIEKLFARYGKDIALVLHAAAQPSHDWAAREPHTDFSVNANGTLVLLEACRQHCPDASFVFVSTNKVYGDTPNELPLVEQDSRWELDPQHPWAEHGFDESMRIDASKHSLFGASKLAADVLVQEYGRYFGMNTVCFRGGCLTGPAHSGAELHGFLAYLARCAVTGNPYTVFGYQGKQVRDNIHSADLVQAFWAYHQAPRPAAVYNIGGSRHSNCSVLEAIALCEQRAGREFNYTLSEESRSGDHIWWISDVRRFQQDYPGWRYRHNLESILDEIVAACRERYAA